MSDLNAHVRDGDVLLVREGAVRDSGYFWIVATYVLHENQILMVHHNLFDKWVPPGGHVEPDESFSQAARREVFEETGLDIVIHSAGPSIHPPDDNATPEPLPFYVDIERASFRKPAIVQFYFGSLSEQAAPNITHQTAELHDCSWLSLEDLAVLPTFAQVQSLSKYVFTHHPNATTPYRR